MQDKINSRKGFRCKVRRGALDDETKTYAAGVGVKKDEAGEY